MWVSIKMKWFKNKKEKKPLLSGQVALKVCAMGMMQEVCSELLDDLRSADPD